MPINQKICKSFWVALRHANRKNIICAFLFFIWLEKVSNFISRLIDDLYSAIDPQHHFNVPFSHKLRSVIAYLLSEITTNSNKDKHQHIKSSKQKRGRSSFIKL